MRIVVTGSVAYDYLMFFPGQFTEHLLEEQLRSLSVSFLVDTMRRERGGIAANIAYTLALLGGNPTIMATVGQDFAEYQHWLEIHGVDTSAIMVIEGEFCASFFANTDTVQNQIGFFYPGAMAFANRLNLAQQEPRADLVIISPNDPGAMQAYVRECKDLGIPFIYDPSQQTIRATAEDLEDGLTGCTLLAVNEYELHMIQEKTGLTQEQILQRVGALLVTHGKEGSKIYANGECYNIPVVPPAGVVEPTGAGDAFRGGLMRGMQLGLPWSVSGRMGALAATYVLENIGTQNHSFSPRSFVERYRQHFDDNGILDVLL